MSVEVLERRLARSKAKVAALERMIETKSRELFVAAEEARRAHAFLDSVYRAMPSALVVVDENGSITHSNDAADRLVGAESLTGTRLADLFHESDALTEEQHSAILAGSTPQSERSLRGPGDEEVPVLFHPSVTADEESRSIICVFVDLRERRELEMQLRHAQKLESVGQLAAGVAHEINTPIQFVGDSLQFLEEAFSDVVTYLGVVAQAVSGLDEAAQEGLRDAEEEADLDFVREEVPKAVQRAVEGVDRVATIVKAMKGFSHPDSNEPAAADLNQAIEQTLVVANSEYKYVADVEMDLGELPPVVCRLGDVNQVLLNLIVNAAHAIEAAREDPNQRGKIILRTRTEGDSAVVEVTDDGTGIPPHVVEKIFDPFFTTKEVGKGTGQGLAIARNIIVDRHGGALDVETRPGDGSTFIIRLPVRGCSGGREAA